MGDDESAKILSANEDTATAAGYDTLSGNQSGRSSSAAGANDSLPPIGKTELYCKTTCISLIMLGMGTMHAIIGPTLLDLAYNLQVSLSQVSLIFVGQAVGFIIGTIGGGIAIDVVDHFLFMGLVIMLAALLTIAVPFWPTLFLLVITGVVRGMCIRALELTANVALLDVWGKDSSSPMQAIHFMLAVGCGLAPLLVKPFVGDSGAAHANSDVRELSSSFYKRSELDVHTHHSHSEDSHELSVVGRSGTSNVDMKNSHVEWAYLIVAVINIIIGIYTIALYCLTPKRTSKSQMTDLLEGSTEAEKDSDFKFKLKFIPLGVILMFLYFGVLLAYDGYLVTFAVISDLHMSMSDATSLAVGFWSVFAIGRLMAIFYTKYVSDPVIITTDIICCVAASIPLSTSAAANESTVWVCSSLYAFSMASMGPAAISYTNRFINVTGKIAAMYMVGGAVGEALLPFYIGYMMDHYDPMWLMYTVTACTIGMVPVALAKFSLAMERGEKSD